MALRIHNACITMYVLDRASGCMHTVLELQSSAVRTNSHTDTVRWNSNTKKLETQPARQAYRVHITGCIGRMIVKILGLKSTLVYKLFW